MHNVDPQAKPITCVVGAVSEIWRVIPVSIQDLVPVAANTRAGAA